MSTISYTLYLKGKSLYSSVTDEKGNTTWPEASTTPIPVTNDGTQEAKYSNKLMSLSLYGLSFIRKMYEPGNIQAEVLIKVAKKQKSPEGETKDVAVFTVKELKAMLVGRPVYLNITVKPDSGSDVPDNLASGYYIHSILPQYESDDDYNNIYVKLDIYSPDKSLQANKFSRAYLGKTLIGGIVTDYLSDYKKYFPISLRTLDKSSLLNLTYTSGTTTEEYVQPYLVQYNESFYDFVKRVANRCGEAFYFEGGELRFGLAKNGGKTELKSEEVSRVVFQQMQEDPFQVGAYFRDSVKEAKYDQNQVKYYDLEDILDSTSSTTVDKSNSNGVILTDEVEKTDGLPNDAFYKAANTNDFPYAYNSEITSEDYYMILYKDKFARDDYNQVLWGNTDERLMGWFLDILNSTSLMELLAKYSEKGIQALIKAGAKQGAVNEKGNKNIAGDALYKVLFSEVDKNPNHWTTLDYYKQIRFNEEKQMRQTVCVEMGNNYKSLSLGDKITIPNDSGTVYVIVRIDIDSGKTWQRSYDGSPIQEVSQCQRIYAIPIVEGKFYPPLLPGLPYRKAGPQTAFVKDAGDLAGQGRVRIRFAWQPRESSVDDATPWIRMATPMATTGGGMYFKPEAGDEVMVDFENGNVERPFVVGTLYSKNVTAPSSGDRVIVSRNGHTIKFDDSRDAVDFVSGIFPGLSTVKAYGIKVPGIDTGDGDGVNACLGGIELTDKFGFYNIKMSSHNRKVSISSPFGNVDISALTGISIDAPNGDITIRGKNVDISAYNKLSITSGKNIKQGNHRGGYWSAYDDDAKGFGKTFAKTLSNMLFLKFLDLSLVRHILEIIIRPVDGTLQIRSNRYLLMEAGKGSASAEVSNYATQPYDYAQKGEGAAPLIQMPDIVKSTLQAFVNDFCSKFNAIRSVMETMRKEDFQPDYDGNGITPRIAAPSTQKALLSALFQNISDWQDEAKINSDFNAFAPNITLRANLTAAPVLNPNDPKDPNRDNNDSKLKVEVMARVKSLARAVARMKKVVNNYPHLYDNNHFSDALLPFDLQNSAASVLNLTTAIIVPPAGAVGAAGAAAPTEFYAAYIRPVEQYIAGDPAAPDPLFSGAFDINGKTVAAEWEKFVCRRIIFNAIQRCRNAANAGSFFKLFKIDSEQYDVRVLDNVGAPTNDDRSPANRANPFSNDDWGKYVAGIRLVPSDAKRLGKTDHADKFTEGLLTGLADAGMKILPWEFETWKCSAEGQILFSDQANKTYRFKNGGTEYYDNPVRRLDADERALKTKLGSM